MLIQIFYVGIGGFVGAIARFLLYELTSKTGLNFPLATLLVNIIGSALLGFILYSFAPGKIVPSEYRYLVNAGLIGAFTTMGTFAAETIALLDSGAYLMAITNITLNVLLSLFAILGGKWAALFIKK